MPVSSVLRVAEFFAGIGLVQLALEPHGFEVVWANDIASAKQRLYARNFEATHFHLRDVREVRGAELPDIDLATASFPCTDLSLAGLRRGLAGAQSGLFWQFARVLDELGPRRPSAVLIENVPSLASSHGGADLTRVIERLNELGYSCDLLLVDARHFTPQSRARLFIVGASTPLQELRNWTPSVLRPPWIERFVAQHPTLRLHALPLDPPAPCERTLADIVERLEPADPRWWDTVRTQRFMAQLAPLQAARLERLCVSRTPVWAAAYRRTRHGHPVWEIRADALSGCLRTARGGSSKQALVEAHAGTTRLRWMTAREYARLQGAGEYCIDGVPENQALYGFGDAVCVPVVSWLTKEYLRPLLIGELTSAARASA